MSETRDFKRKLPPYTIATVEDLKKSKASCLSIRKKALPFEFPLYIDDKIDIAMVMQKFRKQHFYSGLAAPQLGIMKRLIVFTVPRSETQDLCQHRKKCQCRTKVFLNPSYEKVDDETTEDIECCVSVKSVVAPVPRYARVRYRAFNLKGDMAEGEVSGTTARLIQHEVDHLDGKLFIDLASPDKFMSVTDYYSSLKSKYFQAECSDSS